MNLTVILTIHPKESYPGPDGGEHPGYEPPSGEVIITLADLLGDQTKHDERIGWRIDAVTLP
jgi:hypothetical protein